MPLFPVQAPDGRKDLTELDRQSWVVNYIRKSQPNIIVYATPNAAKRGFSAQRQAKKEGLLAGVFDLTFAWDIKHSDADVTVCWAEMKGYDASGRAGSLTPAQIDWGNAMHQRGHKVACFFSAKSVIEWLAELGAPIRGRIAA
ncbi:hypothetical protein ACQKOE_13935 [Novosphingobium sp. NPDC080210]|uniref:hypothetical protein n=1 Tax=Novosphingobium sp. NPDC080210 TaxID=3390596 RepID=UPI003D0404DF